MSRGSVLYVPASNPRAMEKARGLTCNAVILDLEDAVAPDMKAAARSEAAGALTAGFGERKVVVRINGLDTPWGQDDISALISAGPSAILAPKVASAADIGRYQNALAAAPPAVGLWAMIETCRAIQNLNEIAGSGGRLSGLVMGLNDLAQDMGAKLAPGRTPFTAALSLAVIAARANGLSILDGVFNDLDDDAGLETECLQARAFGFDGKTLIHPRQIDICERAFRPTPDELDFARAVIAAFAAPQNAGQGALQVCGRMVERLHLAAAVQLVAGSAPFPTV